MDEREGNVMDDIEQGYQEELEGVIQEEAKDDAVQYGDRQEADEHDIIPEQGPDIEELAEAVNDILDKVTAIANDNKSFTQGTQEQLKDIENNLLSVMSTLKEMPDLHQSLSKINDNISTNITNLQGALNQINESTGRCVNELQNAAEEIPQKLLEDCTKQNKRALEVAVTNFNAMNAASQKWLKKLGNHTDWATQIVVISGVLTPFLLLIVIYMLYRL